jgi:hypothetical protein
VRREHADALRLDEPDVVSLMDLVEASGLAEDLLRELVAYGALVPIDAAAPQWRFTAHHVVVVRTGYRLQHDFELVANSLAVVLGYAVRIERLEAQLCALRARSGS